MCKESKCIAEICTFPWSKPLKTSISHQNRPWESNCIAEICTFLTPDWTKTRDSLEMSTNFCFYIL